MMDYNSTSAQGQSSVYLRIIERGSEEKTMSEEQGSTMFEARRETSDAARTECSYTNSICSMAVDAPEKKVTLFALRLAVLEKSASGLGTLGFIWATVVLLGGFAITLGNTDFWFITTILLIEAARIFSRSHELEWQHQTTWPLAEAGDHSFPESQSNFITRMLKSLFITTPKSNRSSSFTPWGASKSLPVHRSDTRTWLPPEVPLFPSPCWLFLSKNISKILYWLQLVSASACVSLALMRLSQQDYGVIRREEIDRRNRKAALNIFYSLALAEALLFLMEKAYWEWKISYCKLLEEVNKECGFSDSDITTIRRFFYDAYSKCIERSIFDGLRMDLVSFASELLESNSSDEQLIAARIICSFVSNPRFSDDTLRKIGTSASLMERLLEMLNWKKPPEVEIRRSAAEILSKLAGKKQNALRVAEIPGAMESISSLLHTGRNLSSAADEIGQKSVVASESADISTFNRLGLLILKKLARDLDNRGKIGSTRGLLTKIIDFTHAGDVLSSNNDDTAAPVTVVKRSLEVVKMMVSSPGITGRILRNDVSEIVFTVSNIREILQYGENHMLLQKLGIDILTSLALDDQSREKIGRTGGVLVALMRIFLKQGSPDVENSVRTAAGDALAMLALGSEHNCDLILRMDAIEKLVKALEDPVLQVNTARLLRNLCAYGGFSRFHQLKPATSATHIVLKAAMSEENKLQEAALGLAAQLLRYRSHQTNLEFNHDGLRGAELAARLVQTLRSYQYPSTKVPRIRRFAIDLAIWMMRADKKVISIFRNIGMGKELDMVAETTSQLECFNVFSGSVGLCPHRTTIHSLVDTARELLKAG